MVDAPLEPPSTISSTATHRRKAGEKLVGGDEVEIRGFDSRHL